MIKTVFAYLVVFLVGFIVGYFYDDDGIHHEP